MESDETLRLNRRFDRDTTFRQRSREEILDRYERDVRPGFQKFIEPLREHADLIVKNDSLDTGALAAVLTRIHDLAESNL